MLRLQLVFHNWWNTVFIVIVLFVIAKVSNLVKIFLLFFSLSKKFNIFVYSWSIIFSTIPSFLTSFFFLFFPGHYIFVILGLSFLLSLIGLIFVLFDCVRLENNLRFVSKINTDLQRSLFFVVKVVKMSISINMSFCLSVITFILMFVS